MDYFPSLFIDNELNLEEKKNFLKKIRSEKEFYTITLALIEQEILIREQPEIPEAVSIRKWQLPVWRTMASWIRPLGYSLSGVAATLLLFFIFYQPPVCPLSTNRFIIYEPQAHQVELAGSFTNWQRIPMHQIGSSGYWEILLPVSSGEHRFSYILDNDLRIADPTLPGREKDDFGGMNSILSVEKPI